MDVIERMWTVEDVMVTDVEVVGPEAPFKTLVEKLWLRGVSGLPVVDGAGAVIGVVSEMDLLPRREHDHPSEAMQWVRHLSKLAAEHDSEAVDSSLAELSKALGRTAGDLMTSPAVTIDPEATLTEAATQMHRQGLKRLPVVDADGRLVGIVSRADLLKVFLREDAAIADDVRQVVRRVLTDPDVVTFAVADGLVTLEGGVDSRQEAEALVGHVESVPGVVAVDDRLVPAI